MFCSAVLLIAWSQERCSKLLTNLPLLYLHLYIKFIVKLLKLYLSELVATVLLNIWLFLFAIILMIWCIFYEEVVKPLILFCLTFDYLIDIVLLICVNIFYLRKVKAIFIYWLLPQCFYLITCLVLFCWCNLIHIVLESLKAVCVWFNVIALLRYPIDTILLI